MPVINGVYLKDFAALPSSVTDANIIPIAITGNQIAYRTTVGGIVTDARVTSKILTGLSVTGGAIAATDTILQAFGKVQNQINSKVSSVGLTMPAAFSVANSPITSAGTLAVTAIGAASQYIRGDGALADFPTTGGGGSSVAYYLNGSVSQGTIGGNAYYEMNKTPVIGAGTDFTINANGYIAQFITDANDPASLLIPAGNWNVEMYFSASSNGGNPSFYVEVYKYNGTTFTLLGSSATTPEGITNGTAIDIYYTSVGIPETVLTITDRLAIRVYVTNSGRTITLHTEDNHLSEIVTTFSNGLTALNGLTKQAQYFAVGSTGTDFNIASSVDTHTFNIPSASASNRGLITTGTQTIAGAKTLTGALVGTTGSFASSGGSDTFAINHSSGAGIALNITKGGNGEGIYVNKTSGSGNAVTIIGTLNATTLVKSGGTSSQFLKADGTVDSTAYGTGSVTSVAALTLGTSGTDLSSTVANSTTTPVITLNVPDASATARGVVTTGTQTIAGFKTFSNSITLANGTSNGFSFESGTSGFYSILKAPAGLGASIIVTLPSATGTLALTSQLHDAVTLSAIGSTANANGATLTGQILNLEPASASYGGVVTTGTQTFAGAKTFSSDISVNTYMTVGRGGGGIDSNTALGVNALYSNTTGSLNVALGYQAGYGSLGTNRNTTGSNNIFIGFNSVGLSATASNRTWIGNAATQSTWLGGRLLIGSTTDSANAAIQVTATTLLGLYASATTGIAVQGDSSGTGGTGVYGSSGNGYGGAFANNSTTYPALWVNNNEESAGDIAVFQWIGSSIFTVAPGNSTFNTSVTGRSFIPTFSTVPTNGMYLSAANTLNFATNSSNRFSISSAGAATFSSNALSLQGGAYPAITAKATATFPIFSLVNDAQSAQWNIELGRTTSGNLEFYNSGTKVFFTPAGAATFSSSVSSTEYRLSNLSTLLQVSSYTVLRDNNERNAILIGNSDAPANYYDNSEHYFRNRTGLTQYLTIASTGAATFSSSVSSTEYRLSNLSTLLQVSSYTVLRDNNERNAILIGNSDAPANYYDNSEHYFRNRTGLTQYLTIASTGAATFSANINAVTAFEFSNTNNTSGNGNLVSLLGANCNNTSSYHLIAATGGADKFYLYGNGTYTTVSDRRLKKNISTIQDTFLDKVLKLNIVNYQWNDQTGNDALELGMIAQEVEEIIPSIVHEGRADDNGNKYKGIQASVLPYILIKAIQEQTQIIKDLEARIVSLEQK
jgi:hypothetical protein